ncbi:MAG: MFS transporter [Neisseriaceae bacterium]|nr:MFS transporter [Neisseriaceae bacterium]
MVQVKQEGLAIAVLAVAAFVIVTTEYLIVGLLPALARDFAVSIDVMGWLVTLFAFTVMLFGPVLTALLAHFERKRVFVFILLVFAAANAVAAVANSMWLLALARFVPALLLPVFWGTASETAAQMVGPDRAGRAVARVYLGISAALLLGIPLGTLWASAWGWRSAFWLLSGLSLLMAVALYVWMPKVSMPARVSLRGQVGQLRHAYFGLNVLVSVWVFTAMFTAYTYLADILERLASVPATQVGWWLMGFGAVGLIGNGLGGRWVSRQPVAATGGFSLLLGLAMLLAAWWMGHGLGLMVALALWGIAYTALFPVCQVRVMQAAKGAQALAGTLNVAAANAGTGLGALLGGWVIQAYGLAMVAPVAAVLSLLTLLFVPLLRRHRPE